MSTAVAVSNNDSLDAICRAAFNSEYLEDSSQAIAEHQEAVRGLEQLVAAKSTDKERKATAKRQIKFHQARLEMLRLRKSSGNKTPFLLLPTALSAQRDLTEDAERVALSLDQFMLNNYTRKCASDPNTEIPALIAHLLSPPTPLYTPTLPKALPPTTYHIYHSVEMNGYFGGHFHYLKAKDPATLQTLYVLKALKRRRYQIPQTEFFRAAEFAGPPAVVATVSPIDFRKAGKYGHVCGRDLVLETPFGAVREWMDRQLKSGWGPRRFEYGGRKFVWKKNEDSFSGVGPLVLWEVKKVWPKPGSKTGKMLDEVVQDKVCWGESKARMHSLSLISVKGGVDQVFREYLLASQMTYEMVSLFGHD